MNALLSNNLPPGGPTIGFAAVTMPTVINFIILLGAILLVTIAGVIWAVAFRKRGRKHHHPRAKSARPESPTAKTQSHKRSGRRRRSEPPRNPTLAETHGLPPLREPQSTANRPYLH